MGREDEDEDGWCIACGRVLEVAHALSIRSATRDATEAWNAGIARKAEGLTEDQW